MKTTGHFMIIIGIAMMVCGAVFTFITFGFGIICSWPLILIGFILLIIGVIVEAIPESKPAPIVIQQPSPPLPQPVTIQQQNQETRFCSYCGKPIQSDSNYCPSCGKKIN